MIHPRPRDKAKSSEKALSVLAMAAFLLVFLCAEASGQPRSFTPRITNYFGSAELDITYQSITNTFRGQGRESIDLNINEKVTLGIGGFVYHPRLLVFNISVGLGLQEEYFSVEDDSGWQFGSVKEYEAKFLFLPRHKYNLELYSRRRNPFIVSRNTAGLNPVSYQHGVNLFYKTRPLTFTISYGIESLQYAGDQTDTNTFRFGGNHILMPFRTSLNYTHSDSDSTTVSSSTVDSLFAENHFEYKAVTLKSTVGIQQFDQSFRQRSFSDKSFDWGERFLLKIFQDLNANAHYSFSKTERDSEGNKASSETTSYGGGIAHRFYKSITSTYNISWSTSESDRSQSEVLAHRAGINYRKRIPYGILYSSFSGKLSHTKRTGPLRVFGERHSGGLFPPDDQVTLNETNVDQESIIIRIEEPETGILLVLERGIHYEIGLVGNQTVITLFSVAGISPLIDGDGPFNFRVDYTVAQGDNEYKTTGYSYTVKLDLFNRLISPHYGFSTTKQEVIEGTIPGGPEEASVHTVGISFHKNGISLGIDYQVVESRLNPQKRWLVTADYRSQITPKINLHVKGRYQKTDFEEGEGEFASTNVFTEELFNLQSRANIIFPKRNITMFVGNNLIYRKGISTSYGISLNSGLVWKIGLLRLNSGFNISYLVNELPTGDIVRQDTFVYLRATRELEW